MRDGRLWFLLMSWFLLGFALMIVAVHMVPYLHDRGATLEGASGGLALSLVFFTLGMSRVRH